jgi:hypothetical protein
VTQFREHFRKGILCLSLATTGGCACFDGPCHDQGAIASPPGFGFPTPMCYGYHSTCWRPWPEECPPCPPYALAETFGKPMPGGPMMPMDSPIPETPVEGIPIPAIAPEPPLPAPIVPPAAAPAPRPVDQGAMLRPADSASMQRPDDEARIQRPAELSSRRHWIDAEFTSQPVK